MEKKENPFLFENIDITNSEYITSNKQHNEKLFSELSILVPKDLVSDNYLFSNNHLFCQNNTIDKDGKENNITVFNPDLKINNKFHELINLKNKENIQKKNLLYNPKYRSYFNLNEIIYYEEDEETEYKEYFPMNTFSDIKDEMKKDDQKCEENNFTKKNLKDNTYNRNKTRHFDNFDKDAIIKKTVCSFLNRNGGRIYFGISDNKQILGIMIRHWEKDQAQLKIFNMISTFWPSANIMHLKVLFYPIKNPKKNKFIRDLYIIKLIVKKGDSLKLYSLEKDCFKSYIRSNNQCINLTAENITNEILLRNEKKDQKIKEEINDNIFFGRDNSKQNLFGKN